MSIDKRIKTRALFQKTEGLRGSRGGEENSKRKNPNTHIEHATLLDC